MRRNKHTEVKEETNSDKNNKLFFANYFQHLTDSCFKLCVTKTNRKLTAEQQTCLTNCTDLFNESFQLFSKNFVKSFDQNAVEKDVWDDEL